MIVGYGGVGKSSLLRGLKNMPLLQFPCSTLMAECESLKSSRRDAGASWASGSDTKWRDISEEDEYKEMAQLVQEIYSKSNSNEQLTLTLNNPNHNTQSIVLEDMNGAYNNSKVKDIVKKVMEYASTPISQERTQETWMRVWDCGGQHVFRTILPAFVTSRSMFVLMFDARQYSERTCISCTNFNGRVITQNEYLTTQQLLLRWMATIHSSLCQESAKPSESLNNDDDLFVEYPKILLVGTHADSPLVKQNRQKIVRSLNDACESKPYSRIVEGCCFVDNTTAGCEKEDENYATIREKIHSMGKELAIPTPLSWILFRKYLTEYSKSKPVVELSEILEIASACKIPEKSISSVLEFYHNLGVFYHYSQIPALSQKVIANPHWLIKVIGSLLSLEGFEPKVGTQFMWSCLQKYGILLERLLNAVLKKEENLTPSEITALLKYFLIIAEMNTRSKKHCYEGKEYFVPSMLKPDKNVQTRRQKCDFSAEPLYLTFSTNYLPPGFFTRFAAVLSQNSRFEIIFNEVMCCNRIQFLYGTQNHKNDEVSIIENINNVKINIDRLSPSLKSSKKNIVPNYKQCYKELIDIFMSSSEEVLKWLPDIRMKISLQCHNCSIKDQHYANLPLFQESISVILCQQGQPFYPTRDQEFWFSVKDLDESTSNVTSLTHSISIDSQDAQLEMNQLLGNQILSCEAKEIKQCHPPAHPKTQVTHPVEPSLPESFNELRVEHHPQKQVSISQSSQVSLHENILESFDPLCAAFKPQVRNPFQDSSNSHWPTQTQESSPQVDNTAPTNEGLCSPPQISAYHQSWKAYCPSQQAFYQSQRQTNQHEEASPLSHGVYLVLQRPPFQHQGNSLPQGSSYQTQILPEGFSLPQENLCLPHGAPPLLQGNSTPQGNCQRSHLGASHLPQQNLVELPLCHRASPLPQGASPLPQGASRLPERAFPLPHGASPLPQGASNQPQGTYTVPQGASPLYQGGSHLQQGGSHLSQGASPLPQGASPLSQGTSPLYQGAFPPYQGASSLPQRAPNRFQGAFPPLQGASPLPQGAFPLRAASHLSQGASHLPQGDFHHLPQGPSHLQQGAFLSPQGASFSLPLDAFPLPQIAPSLSLQDSPQIQGASSIIQSSFHLPDRNISLPQENTGVYQSTSLLSQRAQLPLQQAVASSKGSSLLQSISQPQYITDQSLATFSQHKEDSTPFQESSSQSMALRDHVQSNLQSNTQQNACNQSNINLSIKDLKNVVEEIFDARNEWYNLGIALDISTTDLTSMKDQNSEIKDRFRAMLEYWLRNGSNTTWEVLACALGHQIVARTNLMNELAKTFSIRL